MDMHLIFDTVEPPRKPSPSVFRFDVERGATSRRQKIAKQASM